MRRQVELDAELAKVWNLLGRVEKVHPFPALGEVAGGSCGQDHPAKSTLGLR